MRPNQPRQQCPKCPAIYRWPDDFDEHLRVAHQPQEDNSDRPTFSDKDVDEALDSIEVAPE